MLEMTYMYSTCSWLLKLAGKFFAGNNLVGENSLEPYLLELTLYICTVAAVQNAQPISLWRYFELRCYVDIAITIDFRKIFVTLLTSL